MLLYCSATRPLDHAVRIIYREKCIEAEPCVVREEDKKWRDEVAELNPAGSTLTLVERNLVLYDPEVIAEFLDERYPYPPLMPVDPVSRAYARQLRDRFVRELFPYLQQLLLPDNEFATANARNTIRDLLSSLATMFGRRPFNVNSEDMTMLDCFIAPVFWRLSACEIKLPPAALRHIRPYARRLFAHPSFKRSLIEEDRYYSGL